jgi:hypothetical protein
MDVKLLKGVIHRKVYKLAQALAIAEAYSNA